MIGSSKQAFRGAAAAPHKAKPKRPAPFPVRFSEEERALLEAKAGSKPLGTYIRETLLGDAQSQRKRPPRKPKADDALFAKMLGQLGKSDQVKCLFLLLVAAENERISLKADERTALLKACTSVQEIRAALLSALGLRA